MFDPLGVSYQQVEAVVKSLTTEIVAIGQLLIEKGLITEDEWTKATNRVTEPVDQLWQKKKDEMRAKKSE